MPARIQVEEPAESGGLVMISSSSVTESLRRQLLADISSGALPPGSRVGSERALAERYGVSRGTLRVVLASLAEAGLIQRVAGRAGGTFISRAKVERDSALSVGVPAYLARQGYSSGCRVISTRLTAVNESTRLALSLGESALVIEIQRIRLADGIPLSLELARFPAERFPGLLERELGGSVYDILNEHYDTRPDDVEEILEIVSATEEEAHLLNVAEGAPLLSITRTSCDATDAPFEYSYDLFRADRTRIVTRSVGSGLRQSSRFNGDTLEFRPNRTIPLPGH